MTAVPCIRTISGIRNKKNDCKELTMIKTIYRLLLILTALFTLAAISTLIPQVVSKKNIIGYFSHCSFTPISTIILLFCSALTCTLRAKKFK